MERNDHLRDGQRPDQAYTATESKSVQFHEVHQKEGARIQHRRICPKDDKEVPADQTVKGYAVEPDKYVVLSKEEIKAACGRSREGDPPYLARLSDAGAWTRTRGLWIMIPRRWLRLPPATPRFAR